jgi:hypothetical protein
MSTPTTARPCQGQENSSLHAPSEGLLVFITHPKWIWVQAEIVSFNNDGFMVRVLNDATVEPNGVSPTITEPNETLLSIARDQWGVTMLPAVSSF